MSRTYRHRKDKYLHKEIKEWDGSRYLWGIWFETEPDPRIQNHVPDGKTCRWYRVTPYIKEHSNWARRNDDKKLEREALLYGDCERHFDDRNYKFLYWIYD